MADADYGASAPENQVSRRNLLAGAPVALAALAVPVGAAAATPVMQAFAEWHAYNRWLNGPATRGMDDDAFNLLVVEEDAMLTAMMGLPAQGKSDALAKLAAYSNMGEKGCPDRFEFPQVWEEVRAALA